MENLFVGSVNGIHDAVFNRFGGRHEEVTVGVAFDLFKLLSGVAGEDRVEDRTQTHDLFALDLNVGGVMVYALTPQSASELSRQIREDSFASSNYLRPLGNKELCIIY